MVQSDTDRKMGVDLNLSIYSLPKPLSQFLQEVSRFKDNHSNLSEIEEYVDKLEEERRKIGVFKRELPLCMHLLNEVIGALKEEARKGSSNEKLDVNEGAKLETENKKNWMSSAQLWISDPTSHSTNEEEDRSVNQNPFQPSNNTNQGGAFLSSIHPPIPAPLSFMTPTPDIIMDCNRTEENHHPFNKPVQSHHIQKKDRRRRWSQDLHRKFVDALHRLGGPKVATPKQIRDFMQVDGLTNDEVKSHLQKYRIHICKHPLHPTKTLSSSDQPGLSRSNSPQTPLVEIGLFSYNAGHISDGDEDERSDGRSWKTKSMKKNQVLDLEL